MFIPFEILWLVVSTIIFFLLYAHLWSSLKERKERYVYKLSNSTNATTEQLKRLRLSELEHIIEDPSMLDFYLNRSNRK